MKTLDGISLLFHGRRTFIVGLTVCSQSIIKIADRLLSRQNNPFKYILTYKLSQDHLELLFSCIRGKNGFCKNPDVRMFKSSLQRILLRNSIVGSKFSNCTNFQDEGCGSIFSLKWNKRNSPVNDSTPESEEDVRTLFKNILTIQYGGLFF